MSAANENVSKDSMGLVMEFLSPNTGKVNGPNNYLAWTGAMHTIMGARYGPMARVFADQVPTSCPILGPTTYPKRKTEGWRASRPPIFKLFEFRLSLPTRRKIGSCETSNRSSSTTFY